MACKKALSILKLFSAYAEVFPAANRASYLFWSFSLPTQRCFLVSLR